MSVTVLYDMLSVRCSYCGALRGENCRKPELSANKHRQHVSRLNDYRNYYQNEREK